MPRGRLEKIDILSKVYKMKTNLHNGSRTDKNTDWYDGAHDTLDEILNFLNQYYS